MKRSISREITKAEGRKLFLKSVWGRIEFCHRMDATESDKLETLAHSILALLDGCDSEMPGFLVIPNPHPDDEDFKKARGENYFKCASTEEDIAGPLHEMMFKEKP